MTPTDPPSRPRLHLLPLLLLVLLGSLWGLAPSLAKIGLGGGIPPLGYAFWQSLGAGVILLVVTIMRRAPPPRSLAHLRYYAVCAVIGVAVPSVNMLVVLMHIPVGVASIITTLSPLATFGLSQALGLERADRWRVIGIGLGLCGALMILLPRSSLPSPDMAPWVLMAMITPLTYAMSNIYAAQRRPDAVHSLALAAAMQLVSAATLLPIAVFGSSFHALGFPFSGAEWAMLGHMLISTFASLIYFEILRLAGAVYMSQAGYIITATGVIWGMYIFDERHSEWVWAAMVVIFFGLMAATRARRIEMR